MVNDMTVDEFLGMIGVLVTLGGLFLLLLMMTVVVLIALGAII